MFLGGLCWLKNLGCGIVSFLYLSLPLILGQMHLLEDLRSLLHHQCLLVGVG